MSINTGVINSKQINGTAFTGVTVTEDVFETAELNSFIYDSDPYTRVQETAELNDYVYTSDPYVFVLESGELNDQQEIAVGAALYETAELNDSYAIVRLAPINIFESGHIFANYEISRRVLVDVLETAEMNDYTYLTDAITDVFETAELASYTYTRKSVLVDVLEAGELGDSVIHGGFFDVFETAELNDYTYLREIQHEVVYETAAANDAVYFGDTRRVDVYEEALISGRAVTALNAVCDVYEVGYLSDQIISSDGLDEATGWSANDAWTANVSSWGMSRYSGVGLADLSSRYGVSVGGLYERSEVGADMRIESGFLDFGGQQKKRVSALYIRGSYDNSILVDVTAEVGRVRTTYTYTPTPTDPANPTEVRVKVGKKFSSVYYKFGVTSVGQAALFDCDTIIARTQRRLS